MSDDILYWWCEHCQANVDILVAYDSGVFCQSCGGKVVVPPDGQVTGRVFWDFDEDTPDDSVITRWTE